jgi:hypothetical protein
VAQAHHRKVSQVVKVTAAQVIVQAAVAVALAQSVAMLPQVKLVAWVATEYKRASVAAVVFITVAAVGAIAKAATQTITVVLVAAAKAVRQRLLVLQ